MAEQSNRMTVEVREKVGGRTNDLIRAEGCIPAVIYGKGFENVHLKVKLKEFLHYLDAGVRMLVFDIAGSEQMVIVQDVQYGTYHHQILHADFKAVTADTRVKVNVDITLSGESQGSRDGGVVNQDLYQVEVECTPMNIPTGIELDISALELDASMCVKDLPVLTDVTYLVDAETSVVSVRLPRGLEEEEAAEEEGESLLGDVGATSPEIIGEKEEEEGDDK